MVGRGGGGLILIISRVSGLSGGSSLRVTFLPCCSFAQYPSPGKGISARRQALAIAKATSDTPNFSASLDIGSDQAKS